MDNAPTCLAMSPGTEPADVINAPAEALAARRRQERHDDGEDEEDDDAGVVELRVRPAPERHTGHADVRF